MTAEFDGVPPDSLIQGTGWRSTEAPLGLLRAGLVAAARETKTRYHGSRSASRGNGPGNTRERWYDSLGGTVNFISVQPAPIAGGNPSASYGSFGTV